MLGIDLAECSVLTLQNHLPLPQHLLFLGAAQGLPRKELPQSIYQSITELLTDPVLQLSAVPVVTTVVLQ